MGYNIEFDGELVEVVGKELVHDTVERLTLADGRILERGNASEDLKCVGQTAEPQAVASEDVGDPDEVPVEELTDEEIGESHEAADALEADKDEAAEIAAVDEAGTDGIIWGDAPEGGLPSDVEPDDGLEPSDEDARL